MPAKSHVRLVPVPEIGILHLPHSIAGNVEVLFGLFISSEIPVLDYVTFLGLATVGNVVGGACLPAC